MRPLRAALLWAVFFSLCVNLLILALPLYLLQVFDRVLTSRSLDTLSTLTLIVTAALLVLGFLEALRRLMLSRLGVLLQQRLGVSVLERSIRAQANGGVSDLASLRAFLGGAAILPLLDAPWSIVFLAVTFLLHPLLGALAVALFLLLAGLALLSERLTRGAPEEARTAGNAAREAAGHAIEAREVILAMGMERAVADRWRGLIEGDPDRVEDRRHRLHVLASLSRTLRVAAWVAVLATGAVLVIDGLISPGAMLAATILVARALDPLERLIGSWEHCAGARDAWRRLRDADRADVDAGDVPELPAPEGRLAVSDLAYRYPDAEEPALEGVSFELAPGESLGIIGPTGAGKTTLVRCVLGVLSPQRGDVRLDGMTLPTGEAAGRDRHIGYLPQDADLLGGTVAENIARFAEVPEDRIQAAARLAGAHDMILSLAKGYDTSVGSRGAGLSGGQRQRIALARALLDADRLLVLDEPNPSQDRVGEEALLSALRYLKKQRVTSLLIAHRPAITQYVDKLLVLRDGKVVQYGPREEVLARLSRGQGVPAKSVAAAKAEAPRDAKGR